MVLVYFCFEGGNLLKQDYTRRKWKDLERMCEVISLKLLHMKKSAACFCWPNLEPWSCILCL